MLCEDITPELTAYNAYKKTVWLRSRAERAKMYAVGDAYRLHTKCIQEVKERNSSSTSSLILSVLISSTARF